MRGQWRFALMIVAALLVAAAVWTWLPPSDESQDAVQDTIVRFEAAGYLTWPDDSYGRTSLPANVQDDLRRGWARVIEAVAEGPALADMKMDDPVAALFRAVKVRGGRLPIARRGEVVYFDFRRRTLSGELRVRAAYDIVQTTGRWDPERGTIIKTVEDEPSDWCQVFDYTLRQHGDTWRVVDKDATSGPNGGPPYYYSPSTGEYTQDTGA